MAWKHKAVRLVLVALLVALSAGCASLQRTTRSASLSDAEVQKVLAERLASDPNGEMCQAIASRFNAGDNQALRDYLNRRALVERGIASATMSAEDEASWRRSAPGIDNLSYVAYPKETRFFCLGTYEDPGGAPILLIRLRRPRSFGHLILRLGSAGKQPIDDWMMAKNGYWHSYLQTAFESPAFAPHKETRTWMFRASFDDRFEEIIAKFETLPRALKDSPLFFRSYVNAVVTVTIAGKERQDPRFAGLEKGLKEVFDHPLARAHWLLVYYARMGDIERAEAQLQTLSQPYRDPIASDMKEWLEPYKARAQR